MKRTGFTLVEILIVVIILGILAAIVIPQFTEASNDARESSLKSDLQMLRSQLELYKVQHLERYPNINAAGSADTDVDNFKDRLLLKTDQDGTLNTAGKFGPYMQKFPSNPFVTTGQDTLKLGTTADGTGAGWMFDPATGRIFANDTLGDPVHSSL